MISKQNMELVRSLAHKKGREETGLFVAEGEKMVFDLLQTNLALSALYFTAECAPLLTAFPHPAKMVQVSAKEMDRLSAFKTPSGILAVFGIPYRETESKSFAGLSLVLDGVQDPGNLGTIIRLADWFGIKQIFCSENCVDSYNPKCIQSTMGAIARVEVRYLELKKLLEEAVEQNFPVYGTYMEGENLYQAALATEALVVMGSEGQGISPGLERFLTKKISIPAFPAGAHALESLNVAISAAIVCAEFRRR